MTDLIVDPFATSRCASTTWPMASSNTPANTTANWWSTTAWPVWCRRSPVRRNNRASKDAYLTQSKGDPISRAFVREKWGFASKDKASNITRTDSVCPAQETVSPAPVPATNPPTCAQKRHAAHISPVCAASASCSPTQEMQHKPFSQNDPCRQIHAQTRKTTSVPAPADTAQNTPPALPQSPRSLPPSRDCECG